MAHPVSIRGVGGLVRVREIPHMCSQECVSKNGSQGCMAQVAGTEEPPAEN